MTAALPVMPCNLLALSYAHKHKKRSSHLQTYYHTIYNSHYKWVMCKKREVSYGKCGFIGFAGLRVSMLCNLFIFWPERYKISRPGTRAAVQQRVQTASPGCSSTSRVQRHGKPAASFAAQEWLPCIPVAECLQFTSGLSPTYRKRQDLSCL